MEAQDGNQLERARAFLRGQLAAGARPAKDLYDVARKGHGISRAMVWLAKKDLGIVDERIGFGRGSTVHWRLPREGAVSRESQTAQGVRGAWDFWLSQHPVSLPDIIHGAVRDAVREWMEDHAEEIIAEAVRGVRGSGALREEDGEGR